MHRRRRRRRRPPVDRRRGRVRRRRRRARPTRTTTSPTSPGTETITPAPLTITADDRTRVYGATRPCLHRRRTTGFVNGDGEGDVDGLDDHRRRTRPAPTSATTRSTSPARRSPNYDIAFVDRHRARHPRTASRSPPTTRAASTAPKSPAYTASYDGLVNGDTKADVTGPDLRRRAERLGGREVRHHAVRRRATTTTTSTTPQAPSTSPRRR